MKGGFKINNIVSHTITGKLSKNDNQKFFPIKLAVPKGTSKLKFKFTYWPVYMEDKRQAEKDIDNKLDNYYERYVKDLEPALQQLYKKQRRELSQELVPLKNQLNFSLYSPSGKFRGRWDSPHYYGKELVIDANSQEHTAPGFLSGPLVEGDWTVEIETHGICSREVKYELEITYYQEKAEEKWYKGELHLHTHHSDGQADLISIVKAVQEQHLDFFALSDHNTISGWSEIFTDQLTIIPSMELTTFFGHAVALGIESYIDWRTNSPEDDLSEKIKQIHIQGGLFSIAHPFNLGRPICMGCEWEYSQLPWDEVDLIEIWVRNWTDNVIQNTLTRRYWHEKLKEGFKIVAVGSNDLHDPQLYHSDKSLPFTYVKAEKASKEHILNALLRGKVYISSGPEIEFTASSQDNSFTGEIGDTIVYDGGIIRLNLLISKLSVDGEINLYENGQQIYTENIAASSEKEVNHFVQPGQNSFYYWEIKNKNNKEVLTITNPIFFVGAGE